MTYDDNRRVTRSSNQDPKDHNTDDPKKLEGPKVSEREEQESREASDVRGDSKKSKTTKDNKDSKSYNNPPSKDDTDSESENPDDKSKSTPNYASENEELKRTIAKLKKKNEAHWTAAVQERQKYSKEVETSNRYKQQVERAEEQRREAEQERNEALNQLEAYAKEQAQHKQANESAEQEEEKSHEEQTQKTDEGSLSTKRHSKSKSSESRSSPTGGNPSDSEESDKTPKGNRKDSNNDSKNNGPPKEGGGGPPSDDDSSDSGNDRRNGGWKSVRKRKKKKKKRRKKNHRRRRESGGGGGGFSSSSSSSSDSSSESDTSMFNSFIDQMKKNRSKKKASHVYEKPNMGGLVDLGKGNVPYTGGKPKADWSGLEESSLNRPTQATYMRSIDEKASDALIKRVSSIYSDENRYQHKGDIRYCLQEVKEKLEFHGMDTISYRPDPQDASKMICIPTDYAKYTIDKSRKDQKEIDEKKYDKYDRQNDRDAKKMLLASLHPDLRKTLDSKISDDDNFTTAVMVLANHERPLSGASYLNLEKQVLMQNISKYPQNNISAYCDDLRVQLKELETAGAWDSKNNPTLTRLLIDAGGAGDNPEYSNDLWALLRKQHDGSINIFHKTNAQKIEYMQENGIDHMQTIDKAESNYKAMRDGRENLWPFCRPQAKIAMVRRDEGSQRSNKSSNKGRRSGKSKHGNQSHNSKNKKNWKHVPPSNNMKSIKKINGIEIYEQKKDGKTFQWCQKCNRWTTSHNTATHIDGRKSNNRNDNRSNGNGNGGNNGSGNGNTNHNNGGKRDTLVPTMNAAEIGWMHSGSRAFLLQHVTRRPQPRLRNFKPQRSTKRFGARFRNKKKKRLHKRDIVRMTSIHPNSHSPQPSASLQRHTSFRERSHPGTTTLSVILSIVLLLTTVGLNLNDCYAWIEPATLGQACQSLTNMTTSALTWAAASVHSALNWLSPVKCSTFLNTCGCFLSVITWISTCVATMSGKNYLRTHFPEDYLPEPVRRGTTRRERRHMNFRKKKFRRAVLKHNQKRSNFFWEGYQLIHQRLTRIHNAIIRSDKRVRTDHLSPRSKISPRPKTRSRAYCRSCAYPRSRSPSRSDYWRKWERCRKQSPSPEKMVYGSCQDICRMLTAQSHVHPRALTAVHPILQHPNAVQSHLGLDGSFPIIWDSGASMCITGAKSDFIGGIRPCSNRVEGISDGLEITGVGTIRWSILDTKGRLRHLELPSYYAPKAGTRLVGLQSFTKTYPNNPIKVSSSGWIIEPDANVKDEASIEVHISPINNLPTSMCYKEGALKKATAYLTESIASTHQNNLNLSEPHKELIRWHNKLGHVGMRTVQFLLKTGALANTRLMRQLHTRVGKIPAHDLPKCAACQFGRQTNRAVPGSKTSAVRDRQGITSADRLHPGDLVFIDHFHSTARGRKNSGKGNAVDSTVAGKSYGGGCIFVDAATGHVDVELQTSFSGTDTVFAVRAYQDRCADRGIQIKSYQSDNGSQFTSKQFEEHLGQTGITNRYSSAGSHHQNGRAERAIRTIMAMARTMLLHSAMHWPDSADPTLWPQAVEYAVYIYNRLPNVSSGISPFDMWSKTKYPLEKLHNLHVFGCPVYVLEKKLADGKSLGRWKPRSKRCVYVGVSDKHSGDAALVLNPETRNITTQWNVVFDDWFSTIATDPEDMPDFSEEVWSKTFKTTTAHFHSNEEAVLAPHNLPHPESIVSTSQEQEEPFPGPKPLFEENDPNRATALRNSTATTSNPRQGTPDRSGSTLPELPRSVPKTSWTVEDEDEMMVWTNNQAQPFFVSNENAATRGESTRASNTRKRPAQQGPVRWSDPITVKEEPVERTPSETTVASASEEQSNRRTTQRARRPVDRLNYESLGGNLIDERTSRRTRRPVDRLNYDSLGGNLATTNALEFDVDLLSEGLQEKCTAFFAEHGIKGDTGLQLSQQIGAQLATLNEESPERFAQAFKAAKKNNPDIFSFEQAMNDGTHRPEWVNAACKEIGALEDKECWVHCLKSEAGDEKIIPCTWVFVFKRNPAGEITKCKARICLRGDLMESDAESYAPVVAWSTIRFFLCLSVMLKWITISVDWNNAFVQATLKKPMYMHTPRGFKNKFGHHGCLKVTKSLYGSKFAPRDWYMHLRKALLKLGFRESPIDKCLFQRENMLLILYVDDAGIAAPNRKIIMDFVQELRDEGFDLDIEGDFNSYLGIGIEELPDGRRHMTQKGLINKIIETTKMTDANPNWTPTHQVALGSDPDGEPYDNKDWNYASVVGMLLYVSNNTRPDITFAVSQLARFTASPKKSHARAVKTLVRYLCRNPNKGIYVKWDGTFNLDEFVDADFAGLYGRENENNPISVKSRYGFIVKFGGVPLIWKTQLISEICCSTLHAEYVGLSNAVRCLIPIRALIIDTLNQLKMEMPQQPKILSTVFEDNQGAYLLALNQRLSPRTKYFCVKYHHFWSLVYHKERNPQGYLHVEKCESELMDADYFTKGLTRFLFEANRKRVQGW